MTDETYKGYKIVEAPSGGFTVLGPDNVELVSGYGTVELAKQHIDAYTAEGEPTSEDLKSVWAGATGIVPPGTGKA
jgi:hypothetical protein